MYRCGPLYTREMLFFATRNLVRHSLFYTLAHTLSAWLSAHSYNDVKRLICVQWSVQLEGNACLLPSPPTCKSEGGGSIRCLLSPLNGFLPCDCASSRRAPGPHQLCICLFDWDRHSALTHLAPDAVAHLQVSGWLYSQIPAVAGRGDASNSLPQYVAGYMVQYAKSSTREISPASHFHQHVRR